METNTLVGLVWLMVLVVAACLAAIFWSVADFLLAAEDDPSESYHPDLRCRCEVESPERRRWEDQQQQL